MIINTKELYDDGFLRVEHRHYYIAYTGKLIKLARAEFLIISKLAQNCDRFVLSRDIWSYVWQDERPFNKESLKVNIHALRQKLKPHGITIETMVNIGYKLVTKQNLKHLKKFPKF